MSYKIIGSVTNAYAVPQTLSLYLMATGEMVQQITLNSGAYEFIVSSSKPHYLTLTPNIGNKWHARHQYYLGAYVFHSDPQNKPYYFVCVGAGISGSQEPNFFTTPITQTYDGLCIWERVERIPEPQIQFPIIPKLY